MKINILILIIICGYYSSFAQKSVIDKKFENKEGSLEVAVAAINTKRQTLDNELSQQISDIYKNQKGYNTNASFFNTEFVKDGTFDKLFNADRYRIKKLHLTDNLDYICLAKYTLNKFNTGMAGMLTADAKLEINIVDVASGSIKDALSFTDTGIGVNQTEAERSVVEKLLKNLK